MNQIKPHEVSVPLDNKTVIVCPMFQSSNKYTDTFLHTEKFIYIDIDRFSWSAKTHSDAASLWIFP